ncbi:hypothetical protein HBI26_027310 [Parastagonospora nodorum]|nr:hypothetical protein HBH71_226250 [Parastagonospora nodorum]KAH5610422.1 hypothetical protein HBI26_027310 [Parastagonospora nodorum]
MDTSKELPKYLRSGAILAKAIWSGARQGRCNFEAEVVFFSVGGFITVSVGAYTLVGLIFIALFAFVPVAPDVVALELGWLVADGEGTRRLHWPVACGVWVVVVAIVFVIRKSDEARPLGVATDDGASWWRRRALSYAHVGEVKQ